MAIFNINGDATITDIISGIYQGSGSITTAKRIQGGSFSSVTFKSMPTNTSTTRHNGGFSSAKIEFTNTGLVEFTNSSTGTMTATKGPTSTIQSPTFNTQNIWEDSSTAGRFLLLRFGGATIAGGTGSTAYSGTRVDNGNPYYTATGRTWELRQTGDIFYERGTQDSGDNYSIIKHTATVCIVRSGGVTLTIEADNGSNFTDNVVPAEDPFTVNVVFPSGGTGRVKFGGSIKTTTSFEEDVLDRGDTVEVAWVKAGSKMFYGSFTVEQVSEGGTQTFTVTDTPEPYPNNETIPTGTEVNSVTFSSNRLVVDCDKVVSDAKIMNRLIVDNIMGTTYGLQTILTIFDQQNTSFYRSLGNTSGWACDPDVIKMTSATAMDATQPYELKEITPFYEDTKGRAIESYIGKFTDQDRDLFSINVRTGLSIDNIDATLNERGLTSGTMKNLVVIGSPKVVNIQG